METFLIRALQLMMSLSLLVIIHEGGHFFFAKLFKVRVTKFYLFFDPWFSLFKFKPKNSETEYGVGWLPLGGYVQIAGMVDETQNSEDLNHPVQDWEFRAKPAWQRFIVMIAGVTMNVLLAIVIYSGIRYVSGESYMANDDVKWGYVFNDTAKAMGFQDGDKVVSIDGKKIDDVNEIRAQLLLTKEARNIVVNRAGEQVEFTIPFESLLEMRRNRQYEDLY